MFGFALIPLACLLTGQINRRGQLARVLVAIGFAFVFQSLDIGVQNLASRYASAIPTMYLVDLLPVALASPSRVLMTGQASGSIRLAAHATGRFRPQP